MNEEQKKALAMPAQTGNARYLDDSRSYHSEGRLMTALASYSLHDARPLIVRNSDGRWTAVFSATVLRQLNRDITAPARQGFMTLD